MVQPRTLILLGYWDGPEATESWPDVRHFVDQSWDEQERDFIVGYLRMGWVVWAYMGYSICRICGKADNGDLELSDGTYLWPNGLGHYVAEHGVRLPGWFVSHAHETIEALEEADRGTSQWRSAVLEPVDPPKVKQARPDTNPDDHISRTIF